MNPILKNRINAFIKKCGPLLASVATVWPASQTIVHPWRIRFSFFNEYKLM